MPATIDLPQGQPQTLVTGIYVARGDDTLGPYNSTEAAVLVRSGCLLATDYAARDGDAAWVPLAEFLPADFPPRAETPSAPEFVGPARAQHPQRWRGLTAAFTVFLAVPLVIAGGVRWRESCQPANPASTSVPIPTQATATPVAVVIPSPSPARPAAIEERPLPSPQVVAEQPAGPLQGSLSLPLSDGGQTALAGIRVMAFPLAALETALAPATAAAQAARDRLDPQIEAAAAERSTRLAEEQSALQAWRDAPPADPMRPSLRFAYTGAKASTLTAEGNYRYLLNERAAAAGGKVFFSDLPEPALSVETDAGGRFMLPLPTDDTPYAVAASARQTAEDGAVHLHYWVVNLSPAQRSGREPLRLDGGNLTSSPAAESLIHTAD